MLLLLLDVLLGNFLVNLLAHHLLLNLHYLVHLPRLGGLLHLGLEDGVRRLDIHIIDGGWSVEMQIDYFSLALIALVVWVVLVWVHQHILGLLLLLLRIEYIMV